MGPAVLGPAEKRHAEEDRRRRRGQGLQREDLALISRRRHQGAVADRPGRERPARQEAEADQIAFSMADKGIPVEYVLYPDEGHGWARPPNRIDFNGRTELFLKEHLGGRAEAFVPPEGNTAQFPLADRK